MDAEQIINMHAAFTGLSVVTDNTGFHTDLLRGQIGKNGSSEQVFIKSAGRKAEDGLSQRQAYELALHMRTFDRIATELGVPVAPTIGHIIQPNGHEGKVMLSEAVKPAGVDLRKLFSDPSYPDDVVKDDLRGYLEMFRRVRENGRPGRRVSLDPALGNFAKDSGRRLWYIDHMPPRYEDDTTGVRITESPEPPEQFATFIYERYYGDAQVEVLYPQVIRGVAGRKIPADEVKMMIGYHLGPDAFRRIDLPPSERERVLTEPTPWDVDKLRILAAEAQLEGGIDASTMNAVYKATHIHIGGILPDATEVQQAARMLPRA